MTKPDSRTTPVQPQLEVPPAQPKPRRRILYVGPGLALALAVSALIGSGWIKSKMEAPKPSGGPIVERQVVTFGNEEALGPTPRITFLIERKKQLSLSPEQLAKLVDLRGDYDKTCGPKLAQANAAAAKAQDYLSKAKSSPRTPVAHIQSQAGEVIALSGELSAARRSYWTRAMAVLTSDQHKAVDSERKADWAAKMKRLKSSGLTK